MNPGAEPIRALVEPFLQAWQFDPTDPRREMRRTEWIDSLRNGRNTVSGLLDATEGRLQERGQSKPTGFFLYIDQGEELYARAADRERREFSCLISKGLADPRLLVLMSMRSDFLGNLQIDEPLFAAHRKIDVPPLREPELRKVVSRPAEALSARFETDGLVDLITRRTAEDSVKDAGALPLLSYTLDDMWTKMQKRDDGVLRLPAESFEPGGVLADRANTFLTDHPAAQEIVRRIFTLKLATVREDGEPTRRRAPKAEFDENEWRLVTELADHPNRLLATATPENRETYAEVAHEAIFRRWDKLRDWINAERDFLTWKTELADDRKRWESAPDSSKSDALLMGIALAHAQGWIAKRAEDLPKHDREFVELSRRAEIERREAAQQREIARIKAEEEVARLHAESDARKQRERANALRNRIYKIASIMLLVMTVLAVLAVYAWVQSEQSRQVAQTAMVRAEQERDLSERLRLAALRERNSTLVTQSRFLASLSRKALIEGNPDTAILLALEALPDADADTLRPFVPAADEALRLALASPIEVGRFGGGSRANRDSALSPDERRLATVSDDRSVRLWDVISGRQVASLIGHEDGVTSASFSPDGARLVTASFDRTARLWDVSTGKEIMRLIEHSGTVWSASFSPDGARIVTASEDGTARVWNAKSGTEIAVLRGHSASVKSAVYSPDGARLLTASWDKTARIWNATDGSQVLTLIGHTDRVDSASFSPDGSRIVTASADATARMWDATTGKMIIVMLGHESAVLSAVLSPNGRKVLTASRDQTARLWDAAGGAPIAIFSGGKGSIFSGSFSRDGTSVLTAHEDGITRIWRLRSDLPHFASPQDAIEFAKKNASRCLTTKEREAAFLDREPRRWCVEMGKPPYDTPAWKDWLAHKLNNENPPLPSTEK
jgi:hypothetical protein